MSQRIDMTGQRFGRWTALSYAGGQRWLCRCDYRTVWLQITPAGRIALRQEGPT